MYLMGWLAHLVNRNVCKLRLIIDASSNPQFISENVAASIMAFVKQNPNNVL